MKTETQKNKKSDTTKQNFFRVEKIIRICPESISVSSRTISQRFVIHFFEKSPQEFFEDKKSKMFQKRAKKRCMDIARRGDNMSGARAPPLGTGTLQGCLPAIRTQFWHTGHFNMEKMKIISSNLHVNTEKNENTYLRSPCAKTNY